MSKIAVIAGSSGLVGTELLHRICAGSEFSLVKLLVRKPSGFMHAKVKEYLTDFDRLEQVAPVITGDVFFSCLGSTRKKTPDKQRYFQIDHDYPLEMARIASANGMQQFHLISAVGARAGAANFYLDMKGKTEQDIAAVPFASVHIYRPSFLDGARTERRPLEQIALALFRRVSPLMIGPLRKYRSIPAADVAKAMIRKSLQPAAGVHYYESDVIQQVARAEALH